MRGAPDTIHVLHVDDDPGFLDIASEFLERDTDRISVRTATSAADGLAILADEDVDCIVSDYDMPGTDGIEFLQTVRTDYSDLPFLLYTGKGSEGVASDAISAGVTDYLQKETGTDQYTILANRIENAVDRHRAQRLARESQQRISMFLDQSPLGVVEWNDDFEFVRVNDRATEILGYNESELLGNSWELIVPDADRDGVSEVVDELLDVAGGYRSVNENVTKDGERIVCEWHNRTITDEDGDFVAGFSQFQNITEQKDRERALRRERDRFKTLFEMLPVPAVRATLQDGAPVVRQVNSEFETVFGYDTAAIEGEDLDAYLAPGSIDGSARQINRQLAETGRVTERVRRQTVDGIQVFRLEVVLLDSTTPTEGYALYVPQSEDTDGHNSAGKEAKIEALHDVAVELREVEEPDLVYERIVNAAEEILSFDHAIADVTVDDELVPVAVAEGMDDAEYYEATPIDADDNIAAEVYRTGESDITDDLTQRAVAPADPAFRSALTVPIGEYGIFQAAAKETESFDRTDLELVSLLVTHAESTLERIEHERELYRRTSELEAQNDRLERFAGIISHDLRNPLSIAEGRLELAREEGDSDHLRAVEEAHGRMRTLIEELLALARDSHEVSGTDTVDIAATVERCWAHVETGEATLVTDTDATIRADENRLKQLFENLIRNSVEHGHPDVTVTVGEREDGFYVADDGPGIPESNREAVFETGFTTAADGTGFGLSIVKQIVDAHGWEIQVSESSEGDARFDITM